MTPDELFTRINALNRKNACCILSNVFGVMKSRMDESDMNLILSALEHYEKQEIEEAAKEAVYFGRT